MARVFRIPRSWHRVVIVGLLWGVTSGGQGGWLLNGPGRIHASPPGQEIPRAENEPGQGLSQKQKREILKSQFEKMKRDADTLADLAKSLQDDLSKSNEHVLSLQIVEKAEKIEKLAHRIKTAARGD